MCIFCFKSRPPQACCSQAVYFWVVSIDEQNPKSLPRLTACLFAEFHFYSAVCSVASVPGFSPSSGPGGYANPNPLNTPAPPVREVRGPLQGPVLLPFFAVHRPSLSQFRKSGSPLRYPSCKPPQSGRRPASGSGVTARQPRTAATEPTPKTACPLAFLFSVPTSSDCFAIKYLVLEVKTSEDQVGQQQRFTVWSIVLGDGVQSLHGVDA